MNTTVLLGWSVSTLNWPRPPPEPPALPGHRLELITGRPEGTAYRPGETVKVTVRVSASAEIRGTRPPKHMIRVEVTGRRRRGRSSRRQLRRPRRQGGAAPAPGPQRAEGAWTLRARDVASGVTAVRRFEVVPAE